MKNNKFLVAIFFFYIGLNFIYAVDCGDLSVAGQTYVLNESISIEGATCFNITSENITLNCNGSSITGNNTANTYGIYSNQLNTTILNCVLSGFGTGIYFNGNNGTIQNTISNTTMANSYGIYLDASDYNRILGSQANSAVRYGLYMRQSDYTSIVNSNFTSNSATGLYMENSRNNLIINCSGRNLGSGTTAYGIRLITTSHSNTFNRTYASSVQANAIYLQSGNNNLFDCQGAAITGTNYSSAYGIRIDGVSNTTITGCSIINFTNAIRLEGASNDGLFRNNTFVPDDARNQPLLVIASAASKNTFCLNNFSMTSGHYVNDSNGSNYYNCTNDGKNQGNIWHNVINGSVNITGNESSSHPGLYIGSGGSGYPYNSTNSDGKLSGYIVNWAPLTTANLPPGISPPIHSTPILNSTFGTNLNSENLTCYNQSTQDPQGYPVTNIYNWYLNGSSISALILPFEGGSNSTWTKDYSANGNHGTVISALWNSTAGYDGKGAYKFNGTNRINISHSNSLNISREITMAAWLYVNQFVGDGIIYGKPHTSFSAPYMLYGMGFASSNNRYDIAIADGNTQRNCPTPNNAVHLNEWQHVVATFNGSTAKIYINGIESSSCNFSPFTLRTNIMPLYLGYYPYGSYNYRGLIDDLRIYNYSLSSKQVKALYDNRTNLIVSDKLAEGDRWQCSVTPNNGVLDGSALLSNNLTILPLHQSPSIEIISPVNATYNTTTILVNISSNGTNIWYSWNETNATYSNVINITFFEGSNTLTAWANDSAGNLNSTSITFAIDTIAPGISIILPADGATYSNRTQLVNISTSGSPSVTWYSWNETNYDYIAPIYVIFNEGSNTLYAWANDTAGNLNQTNVSFNIEITGGEENNTGQESSSGRGNAHKTYYTDEQFQVQGNNFQLEDEDEIVFTVKNDKHKLTMQSFNSKRAKVEIESEPIYAWLEKGILYEFDVNSDFVQDVTIRYDGIGSVNEKAMIFIQEIAQAEDKLVPAEEDALHTEEEIAQAEDKLVPAEEDALHTEEEIAQAEEELVPAEEEPVYNNEEKSDWFIILPISVIVVLTLFSVVKVLSDKGKGNKKKWNNKN